jgi:OCT family organic cation transporter-like MFS transporter 4/5
MKQYDKYLNSLYSDFGRYQVIVSITIIITIYYIPTLIVTLPMMQHVPDFTVAPSVININNTDPTITPTPTPTPTVFDKQAYCTNEYYQNTFDKTQDNIIIVNSIINWASELKIVCNTKRVFSLIGTIYFLASIASYLALSNFPDRYGRLRLYKYLNFICLLATLQVVFLNNFGQLLIAAFVTGICSLNVVVSSVMLNENIDKKYTGLIMGIAMSMFPLGGLINTIFMYYFQNWKFYYCLALVLLLINNILIFTYIQESPKWLLANNKQKEFIAVVKFIARFNNNSALYTQIKQDGIEYQIDSQRSSLIADDNTIQLQYRKHTYTIVDLFKYSSVRYITLSLLYIWVAGGVSFYMLMLSLENFTGNIYTDSIIVYTAEFIAETGSGYIADRYGRKQTIFYGFLIASVSCAIFPFLTGSLLAMPFIFASVIGIAASFNVVYIFTAELYPTNVKSLSVSVFFVTYRLAACLVPYVLTIFSNVTFIILFVSVIAVGVMTLLPDTLNRQAGDEIEELKEKIYKKGKYKLSHGTSADRISI